MQQVLGQLLPSQEANREMPCWQILKRYDYAEIKQRMEAKGLALGEVLTREEALKDQQVAHNCASQPTSQPPPL